MIGAGEGLGATRTTGHLHTPVPAGIDEGAHDPVVVLHHQQWRTRCGAGNVAACFGQDSRRAERHGEPAQQGNFGVEARLAVVMVHRLSPHCVAEVCGAVIDVFEDARNSTGIVKQGGAVLGVHDGTRNTSL